MHHTVHVRPYLVHGGLHYTISTPCMSVNRYAIDSYNMRIGLDLHGVLTDPTPVKAELAREYFDVDLPPASSVRLTLCGMDYPAYDRLQRLTFWTSKALEMLAVPGSIECVLGLLAAGDEVVTVTNLAPPGIGWGQQWLRNHRLPPRSLVSVGLGGNKSLVVDERFAAFVDDKPSVLGELDGIVPNRFLFSTPYNQGMETPPGVVRVGCFGELEMALQEVRAVSL